MKIRNLRNILAKKLGGAILSGAMALPAVAILSGGLAFVGTTSGAERIVNGSFEEPSSVGWSDGAGVDNDLGYNTYSHTSNVYYAGDPIPSSYGSGDTYGWAWGIENGSGQFGSVTQLVDVAGDVGSEYTFSAWLSAYVSNDDYAIVELNWVDDSGNTLGSQIFDGNDSAGVIFNADGTGPGDWTYDNWSLYEASGNVPAGAFVAEVTIMGAALTTNGNDAYVDLVSLNVVPEPAGMGLLAIGTLMLVGVLRRR